MCKEREGCLLKTGDCTEGKEGLEDRYPVQPHRYINNTHTHTHKHTHTQAHRHTIELLNRHRGNAQTDTHTKA